MLPPRPTYQAGRFLEETSVVEPERIELSSLGCKPSALPLSYGPIVESAGFEPAFTHCQRVVLPLNDDPIVEPGRIELPSLRCERSVFPLDDGPIACTEGIEPSSGVLEAPLPPRLVHMKSDKCSVRPAHLPDVIPPGIRSAPHTGLEPVSSGGQPDRDPVAS